MLPDVVGATARVAQRVRGWSPSGTGLVSSRAVRRCPSSAHFGRIHVVSACILSDLGPDLGAPAPARPPSPRSRRARVSLILRARQPRQEGLFWRRRATGAGEQTQARVQGAML